MRTWIVVVACVLMGCGAWARPVELHYFSATGCPDCDVMRRFLNTLVPEFPELEIVEFEVVHNPGNWRRMVAMAEAYGVARQQVPMVFVGGVGTYGIGRAVEARLYEEVARCAAVGCPPPAERLDGEVPWRISPLELVLIGTVLLAILLVFGGPRLP